MIPIKIWSKGENPNQAFSDGLYDFIFRKPYATYYINRTEPLDIDIPLWNKTITIEKAYIGMDDRVHLQIRIGGNPYWIPIVIVGGIMLALGLGLWALVRIDRLITPAKVIPIIIILLIILSILLLVTRRHLRSLI